MIHSLRLTGTTDASGALTVTYDVPSTGVLHAVQWIDGDLADGVDAVLSVASTDSAVDQTLLTLTDANVDKWYYPRVLEQDAVGVNLTTHTRAVINGYLKLAITSGGNAKTGGCIVYYGKEL